MTIFALPSRQRGIPERLRRVGPGFAVAGTVAAAAHFGAQAAGVPVMLGALALGIVLNFVSAHEDAQPGLHLASGPLLQIGIALLGLRISFDYLLNLGAQTLVASAGGVFAAIAAGIAGAALAGRSRAFGVLAGGATGICGASAALAISSVLPQTETRDREAAFVIVAVTTLSTIAMVAYPLLAQAMGLDGRRIGILLGATIHDVAQAVGAGYSVSTDVGDTATMVKLFRVALLLPTVLAIAFAFGRSAGRAASHAPIPHFAVAFAVFAACNSLGLVPPVVQSVASGASQWMLVMAVAAIGTRTSVSGMMMSMGGGALVAPLTATVAIFGFVLAGLALGA
jgi:uncharacterized integral membrane protein (TIGR00698 family)